jgi:hypothetical protein
MDFLSINDPPPRATADADDRVRQPTPIECFVEDNIGENVRLGQAGAAPHSLQQTAVSPPPGPAS